MAHRKVRDVETAERALRTLAASAGWDSITVEFSTKDGVILLIGDKKPDTIGKGATLSAAIADAAKNSRASAAAALTEAQDNANFRRDELAEIDKLITVLVVTSGD